jgi:hypothetical protein
MSDLRQAARIAQDWMEYWLSGAELTCEDHPRLEDDVKALRAALAQPDESFCDTHCTWHDHHPDCTIAQPERKPLTEDEIELAYREIWRDLSDGFSHTSVEWIEAGIRYAEKVHGIGD